MLKIKERRTSLNSRKEKISLVSIQINQSSQVCLQLAAIHADDHVIGGISTSRTLLLILEQLRLHALVDMLDNVD